MTRLTINIWGKPSSLDKEIPKLIISDKTRRKIRADFTKSILDFKRVIALNINKI